MQKTIEVELRGLLTKDQYQQLEKTLRSKGQFKQTKRRVLIDYSTFLPAEGIRDRTKDIRLRVTNGMPEIIVKLGKWGGTENRKELSVMANKGEFDKLVEIFAALGLTKGILAIRNSEIYDYHEIEFALVEVPGHSYYFEAEKMIGAGENIAKAKQTIEAELLKLNLTWFDNETFFKYIDSLNAEANEVFDYNNYSDNYFQKRFNL